MAEADAHVSAAEAVARMRRAVSVACPRCGAEAGESCTTIPTHAARWDAYYEANPDR